MLRQVVQGALGALGYAVISKRRLRGFENLLDIEADPVFSQIYDACRAYTMTPAVRMYALYKATRYVVERDIPGTFVECGVWRGGSMMLVALTLKHLGVMDRELYLYDTYSGMNEPTTRDVDLKGRAAGPLMATQPCFRAYAPFENVKSNMHSTGYPWDQIHFVKGDVEETIPGVVPDQIALLRLDTDWYDSTYHEWLHLYPRLVQNGVVIVDDYGHWKGVQEATDTYLRERDVTLLLNRIDYSARIGVKVVGNQVVTAGEIVSEETGQPLRHAEISVAF